MHGSNVMKTKRGISELRKLLYFQKKVKLGSRKPYFLNYLKSKEEKKKVYA